MWGDDTKVPIVHLVIPGKLLNALGTEALVPPIESGLAGDLLIQPCDLGAAQEEPEQHLIGLVLIVPESGALVRRLDEPGQREGVEIAMCGVAGVQLFEPRFAHRPIGALGNLTGLCIDVEVTAPYTDGAEGRPVAHLLVQLRRPVADERLGGVQELFFR